MDERKVKRIYHPPAVPAADLFKGGKQRRVAAYARVSTASDEQLNSVEAQKDYFDKLIRQRPDLIFVDVYADEGITGTSINRREAFNQMVTDALAGNIDLIVTKSISRFARNTVDTLNTIRQLKAANVEVFFEKENIYTMDSKGNKRKAEAMLAQLINEYQGMESVEPVNRLLSQHIAMWIERDRPHIAVTTYNQYVNMLNLHIAPYFDARVITVGSLTPGDLEDYYRDKVASGLSPNTVIKHHAIIRSSLQWAMKHQYIRYNPADLADKPSRVKYRANEPYSVEEIVQLLTLTQNEPIAVPIFLASFYGLRRSELLGLRWSAIDFQNGWIHIETTVVKEKHGDKVVSTVRDGTTKTESSRRSLPLCQYTYNYFSWLRQRQLNQMQLCGNCYNMQYLDFVCVDEMGMLL